MLHMYDCTLNFQHYYSHVGDDARKGLKRVRIHVCGDDGGFASKGKLTPTLLLLDFLEGLLSI